MAEMNINFEKSKFNCIKPEKITIIGTGTYGISFGKRLLHYGYHVVYGSRRPDINYLKECFGVDNTVSIEELNFSVVDIADAWNKSDNIVILAVNSENSIYENIADQVVKSISEKYSTKNSKTVIEISNLLDSVDIRKVKISNAEKLNNIFKLKLNEYKIDDYKINVVKGFNLINANEMSLFIDDLSKNSLSNIDLSVPIAGNDKSAKQQVIDFCQKIGLRGYDIGELERSALQLEISNKTTFDDWKYPFLITALFLIFNFLWISLMYFFFAKKPTTLLEYVRNFSILGILNKVLGFTALHLLAFVYLSYAIASIYQLGYSTKYKRFPKYLDFLLKTRKQFGLFAFSIATMHAIASISILDPFYMKSWYIKLGNNTNGKMTTNGELNVLTGITAYLLMVLLAISSINSIAKSLNWNEWRFVQSKLGLSCLTMAVLHDAVMYFRIFNERTEQNHSLIYLITRVKLIALYFPLAVLILRFIFAYFPPITRRIKKIRNGIIVAKV